MRLLDRINKTGTTVVMATHDQRIVNMMRKRVIQFDRGTSSATRPEACTSDQGLTWPSTATTYCGRPPPT
jgi:ABC-type lipoprotein export system ATPase subunit